MRVRFASEFEVSSKFDDAFLIVGSAGFFVDDFQADPFGFARPGFGGCTIEFLAAAWIISAGDVFHLANGVGSVARAHQRFGSGWLSFAAQEWLAAFAVGTAAGAGAR